MKYLFFDTESGRSNGDGNICEFGYVITDEDFNIQEQSNLYINPDLGKNWDWYAVKKILTNKVSFYESKEKFPKFYEKIKEVIYGCDYIFGHSTINDVIRINQECTRYNLDYINYTFYDIKEMYKDFINTKKNVSLINILEERQIENSGLSHNAEKDAYDTMLSFRNMIQEINVTVSEFIFLCTDCENETINGEIRSLNKKHDKTNKRLDGYLDSKVNFNYRKNNTCREAFSRFISSVNPREINIIERLLNKKISVSINYEDTHFKETLNLIQLIYNSGGEYTKKASECNLFIKYDEVSSREKNIKCSRQEYVNEQIKQGKNIEILSMYEFLKILCINEEYLTENEYFYRESLYYHQDRGGKRNKEFSDNKSGFTISEIISN